MNEKEESKTIEWYEAQVKELRDIRKIYYKLYEDNGKDAYFPDLIKEKLIDKELITKLADDVWAMAKRIEENSVSDNFNYKMTNDLKTISSCLHCIRREDNIEWYKNKNFGEKE